MVCTKGPCGMKPSSTACSEKKELKKRNDHSFFLFSWKWTLYTFTSDRIHVCCSEHQGRLYDDFLRLCFFHGHREDSTLAGELIEESDQFRFLHVTCLVNHQSLLTGFLPKPRQWGFPIPSTYLHWHLPLFIHSRRFPSSYSFPSLISSTLWLRDTWCAYIFISFTGFTVHHSFSVTFFPLTLDFFYSVEIKSSGFLYVSPLWSRIIHYNEILKCVPLSSRVITTVLYSPSLLARSSWN
jgi:hypothetical protein